MSILDEDSVDEVLYLARANEASELEQFLTTLSTQVSRPKDQILAEAVDPYSQNTALHYAAANGHIGTSLPMITK
jgi:predicted DNA-binding protein